MLKYFMLVLMVLVALTTQAHSAIDLTGFAIDLTPVESLIGVIVVAMGAMYVIRKFIKTGNRS